MILESEFLYEGFGLVAWTGIFLGVLHSIMPCEDKGIFCFYAFGVSRDWKQAFRILNFYGFGLFLMNITIGTILAYFAAGIGSYFEDHLNKFLWNGISSFSLIVSGIVMLIQLRRKKYWPHSEQFQELTENIGYLSRRKRTAFLLGMLAGIPPCVFELAVYIHAMGFAVNYGWGNGVWTVFFFGIGTWLGLFPLALLGSMSGRVSKFLKSDNLQRIRMRVKQQKQKMMNQLQNSVDQGESDELKKEEIDKIEEEASNSRENSKLELFSGIFLILLGVIFLILAIAQIDIFALNESPRVPAPFNFFQNL